jgi:peptide/nickel transport system substrate-binding protein
LHVRLDAEPTDLNPLLETDEGALLVVDGPVYETLLECPSPDAPTGAQDGYRPRLAESWQVSPDGLKVTLKLRQGVRWHDGYAFSALDAHATLDLLLLPHGAGSPVLKATLQDVATVEVAAGGLVRLNLKRPSDFALRALCEIPILPEHLLHGGKNGTAGLGRQPVGTGPFRFASWERGKRIHLERAPAYWGSPALLGAISFEIDVDAADALVKTRRGDFDVLPRILPIHYPDQVDATSLRGGELTVRRLASRRWVYLGVNHRRAPLDDVAFRRGLSALWDRPQLSRALHGGLARPLAAPPIADVPLPPTGRAAAVGILDTAGYRDTDADGVRELGGKPVRVGLLVASGAHAAAVEARSFVLEARKVGVLVDTTAVDPTTMMARVRKGDFDLALLAWQGTPQENPGLQFGAGAPFNYWGYKSPELESLLDELRRSPDEATHRRVLGDVAQLLGRDQPVIALYRLDVPTLIARRVHGIAAVGDRWDLRRAWIEP